MLKRFYFYLCIFLVILSKEIDGKCTSKNSISSISSGTSFGMCRSYCLRSINITSKPLEVIALKEPNYPQEQYPTVQKNYPFQSDQWQQLINLIDIKSFLQLEDRIGCPDCADGGAEWIEINGKNINKRVTFEYQQLIKGFEGLIQQLRQFRDQYVNNI